MKSDCSMIRFMRLVFVLLLSLLVLILSACSEAGTSDPSPDAAASPESAVTESSDSKSGKAAESGTSSEDTGSKEEEPELSSEPEEITRAAADAGADSTGNADVHEYILNTNTKKFHYPDCKSVAKMKDKNKQAFTGTRDEAIQMGYDPCGNCNP